MTARVITITSGKGGVGKTTATANIGVALAALGNKVACVDADIGLRNLDVVMGLENRIVYDIVDVVEGRARLRQAMIKDKRLKEELYLIPAAQTRDKTAVSPSDMIRLCDELRQLVDFILIDSPAGIERGFRNAIAPADEVLIVTNPEVSSVRDADRIIGLIEAEGKGPGRLIINRVKPDMVRRGDMLSPEDVVDILAIQLIGLVPEDETILISTNRGLPAVLQLEQSRAGRAFRDIARRLMGEDVPFAPLDEEKGWMQRLLRRLGMGGQPQEAPISRNDRRVSAVPKASLAPEKAEEEEEKKEKPAVAAKVEEKEEAKPPVVAAEVAKPEPPTTTVKVAAKPSAVATEVAKPESPTTEAKAAAKPPAIAAEAAKLEPPKTEGEAKPNEERKPSTTVAVTKPAAPPATAAPAPSAQPAADKKTEGEKAASDASDKGSAS